MKINGKYVFIAFLLLFIYSCEKNKKSESNMQSQKVITAKDILGNPKYLAISYGGYRQTTRDVQPTVAEIKEDMLLLSAMGVRILRTYNVQLAKASNILKAIKELKKEDTSFEMYVMLGAWIDCKNAWTDLPKDHHSESHQNEGEIQRAVTLAQKYPDIVKIIAVGNEAMVRWAESYYVQPNVILKWVNHLQNLKNTQKLPKDLWITSSDDFASWGGGDPSYRVKDLEDLIKAVDYVSMHTYAYHNTHYNPHFWGIQEEESGLSYDKKIEVAMQRTLQFAKKQYKDVSEYVKSIDPNKTIHIGETGWATVSNGQYGESGSKATDEFKQALYYRNIRSWTNNEGISCFYFEAFDESWKDAQNPEGSENHFGLFTIEGKAKFALWNLVDQGKFKNLVRGTNSILKTYDGNKEELLKKVQLPTLKNKVEVVF